MKGVDWLGEGDDHDGEGEEDQPLEMVVQRAEEAAGDGRDLLDQRLAQAVGIARREGLAGAELQVRGDGHEDVLHALQQAREGEGGEFGGHGAMPGRGRAAGTQPAGACAAVAGHAVFTNWPAIAVAEGALGLEPVLCCGAVVDVEERHGAGRDRRRRARAASG